MLEIILSIIYIIFGIALFIAIIWAILDVLKKRMKTLHKILWIGGLLLFSLIVLIVWIIIRKDYKRKR